MLLKVDSATFFIIKIETIDSYLRSDLYYWEIGEKLGMEPTYSENVPGMR